MLRRQIYHNYQHKLVVQIGIEVIFWQLAGFFCAFFITLPLHFCFLSIIIKKQLL